MDFEATGQLVSIYCAFVKYLRKMGINGAVYQLFTDFKKAYDSCGKDVLHNILISFGNPMKLVRVLKMCQSETYSRLRVGKSLSVMFPFRNGLKQGAAPSPFFFQLCFSVCH